MTGRADVRVSVVIPTFQRRELVVASVRALDVQVEAPSFEVVVVVDGSTDGTTQALRTLSTRVPLTVLEQANSGAARARNTGAVAAQGQWMLFLDDDMLADPRLVAEHCRSYEEGAEAVIGHIPLDPSSPRSLISAGVGGWADARLRRLSADGAELTLHDLLTGQLSVRSDVFAEVGGFDTSFTSGGSFGGEDLDFGLRLLAAGRRVDFNPRAVTWQRYVVEPAAHLRQWRQAGASDVVLARKHPARAPELRSLAGADAARSRYFLQPLVAVPLVGELLAKLANAVAARRAATGSETNTTRRLVATARHVSYLRGAHEAGGLPPRPEVVVLAYHGVRAATHDPIAAQYAVRPRDLDAHLAAFGRWGHRFLDVDELLDGLAGRSALPSSGVVVTFDDCYEDLRDEAVPILRRRNVPALAFAVSSLLGGTNVWDLHLGVEERPLLGGPDLVTLQGDVLEVGAHGRTHVALDHLSAAELEREVSGSFSDLEAAGLPRPRTFSYPYGFTDERVVEAVRRAGCALAFTVEPGVVRAGDDPLLLHRVEVRRGEGPWRVRLKVMVASRCPDRLRRAGRAWRPRGQARVSRLLGRGQSAGSR